MLYGVPDGTLKVPFRTFSSKSVDFLCVFVCFCHGLYKHLQRKKLHKYSSKHFQKCYTEKNEPYAGLEQ